MVKEELVNEAEERGKEVEKKIINWIKNNNILLKQINSTTDFKINNNLDINPILKETNNDSFIFRLSNINKVGSITVNQEKSSKKEKIPIVINFSFYVKVNKKNKKSKVFIDYTKITLMHNPPQTKKISKNQISEIFENLSKISDTLYAFLVEEYEEFSKIILIK
ncbi:MAG: hypothetical protein ACOCP8_02100 [archaeon]